MGVKKLDIEQRPELNYDHFDKINGQHPWQKAVPEGYVLYNVRSRTKGKVIYFNFDLAKEMGLVDSNHPEVISNELEQKLLETFAIQIINEYDILHKTPIPPEDIKPNKYMATRYLQLQHPSRTGKTSGDGRSIWNGTWKNLGKTWDLSSCGTGATSLSPATAKSKNFFRTGDLSVSYGCGYADVSDSLETAIFSQILHQNGTPTERSLCVIEFPKKLALNVRVSENLLRPSHLFNHLKQSNLEALQRAFDYYIERQMDNSDLCVKKNESKYDAVIQYLARTFGQMSAHFESEYLFCWLAWDGDNILLDGKIIDYGSIRQLGLFHHTYRFDDVERWSTNIKEQKIKARGMIQTLIQAIEFIKTKQKKPLSSFRKHDILKVFDNEFNRQAELNLLSRMGFEDSIRLQLLLRNRKLVREFQNVFSTFEQALTLKGQEDVPDGVNTNAVFCMRNILRELPKKLSQTNAFVPAREFLEFAKSSYALKKDLKLNEVLNSRISKFQMIYLQLINESAQVKKCSTGEMLATVISRSNVINTYSRITGDGICHTVEYLINQKPKFSTAEFHMLLKKFYLTQNRNPNFNRNTPTSEGHSVSTNKKIERALKYLKHLTKKYTEDL